MLFSCGNSDEADTAAADEKLMTDYSENLSVIMSRNGRRSYVFVSPLVEGYALAREPYREFRKGVKITTYQDDSLSTVDGVLTANYAIYYEKRELWEAKGNVVVEKSDGKTLYTQQLFWNARTKKIYSNVDSKIVQTGGRDVFIGEGFESDEEFRDWRFRRMKGRMEVDVAPTDSTSSPSAPQNAPTSSSTSSAFGGKSTDSAPEGSGFAASKPFAQPAADRPSRKTAAGSASESATGRVARKSAIESSSSAAGAPESASALRPLRESAGRATADGSAAEPASGSTSSADRVPRKPAADSAPSAVVSPKRSTSDNELLRPAAAATPDSQR